MKLRRVAAVARKESLHVVRDFRSLGMAILIPMMMLILFGFALTLDVDNIPMAVWDQSGTGQSRELISRFDGSRYFAVRTNVDNYRDLVRAIDEGRVTMGLVVPRDFAQNIDAGRDAPVQLIVDGTDSNTATIGIGYADVVAQIYAMDLANEKANRRGLPPVQIPLDVRPRVWFNEDMESRNYIIPGLIAVLMMVIAAMLTSLTVAREWERGTMEQLIATPIKVSELIVGKLIPYFAIGVFAAMWPCCSARRPSF
jgi:ABC-2 type transport system permease protein